MSSILAALVTFALGLVAGAALQRWGDGVRASGHLGTQRTYTEPDGTQWTYTSPLTYNELAQQVHDDAVRRRLAEMAVTDDDGEA